MENHTDHPLTLTVEQAAKLLGIGRSTAYELVHTGDIPSLRLGRRIVVPTYLLAKRLGMEAAGIGEIVAPTPNATVTPDVSARLGTDHPFQVAAEQSRLF